MDDEQASKETFNEIQIQTALKQWLEFGEDMYRDGHQRGYFSGSGWAARCLRAHLENLEAEKVTNELPTVGGYYWYRRADGESGIVSIVDCDENGLCIEDTYDPIAEVASRWDVIKWRGPLRPPW